MSNTRTQDLFLKFNNWYGQSWSNRFPSQFAYDEAIKQWGEEFDGYSDEAIKQAFRVCRERHDLAPTLPQFFKILEQVRIRPPKMEPQSEVCATAGCNNAAGNHIFIEEGEAYCVVCWNKKRISNRENASTVNEKANI